MGYEGREPNARKISAIEKRRTGQAGDSNRGGHHPSARRPGDERGHGQPQRHKAAALWYKAKPGRHHCSPVNRYHTGSIK